MFLNLTKAPCVQTDATLLANNSQHCWMLHVAFVCTPCCMLLDVVACCCAKFETGQTFQPTTPNISFVPWSPRRSATMLDPFAQLFQHCWGHARSLRMDYKDLWVVFFPRCTAGPKLVYPNSQHFFCSVIAEAWRNNVASVCTPLPTRAQHPFPPVCMQHKKYLQKYLLGIPIDRVPTSKSCVFCLGIKFLFFPIWRFLGPFLLQGLFCWKGVMHVITLWGSGGESVLRFSLVALQTCHVKVWSVMRDLFWKNKISFAEEAIGNIIKSSYKSTVGSVSHRR